MASTDLTPEQRAALSKLQVRQDVSAFDPNDPSKLIHPGDMDPETLVTSVHITPTQLMWIRGFIAVYCIAGLAVSFYLGKADFYGDFKNWVWLGMTTHFGSSFFNSFVYNNSGKSHEEVMLMFEARYPWVKYLSWLAYSYPAIYVYVITIVYWVLLSNDLGSKPPLEAWLDISQNGIDIIFMTTELALGRIPLAPAFFIPLMCGPLLYIPLVFVFHHFTGRWPYEFLDISKPYAWAYYVLIVGLVAVVFIIVWKVLRMRDQRRDKLGLQPIIPEKKSLPLVNVPAPAATEPVPLAGVSTVDGSSSPATNIPPSATSSASAAPQPVLVPIPSPTPTPNQQQIQQSTGIASTPQTPPGTTQFGGLTDTLPAGNPQGGADGFLRNILGNTEKWLEGQAGVTNPNAVPETPAPAMSPGGPTGNPTKSWEGLGNTALGGVEHFVEGKFFGAGAAKNTATEQSATPSGAGANAGLNGSK